MWQVSDGINKHSSIQNERSIKDRHKLATLRGESFALSSWRTGKGIPDVVPLNCAMRGQQMGRNAISEKGRDGDSTPPGTSVPGLGSDNPMSGTPFKLELVPRSQHLPAVHHTLRALRVFPLRPTYLSSQ